MAQPLVKMNAERALSLPKQVAKAGGIAAWNDRTPESAHQWRLVERMCSATTVEEAAVEIDAILALGHKIWAYVYFRVLHKRSADLLYALILSDPKKYMPIAYTPTVGEACQKFGMMPQFSRGCYVSIEDRGNFVAVLREYGAAHMDVGPDGKYCCDCIVFSDGGRILGLGDLGAWGMGIPIGKLDLYTAVGGVDPKRTVPVIIDAGVMDSDANSAHLDIRGDVNYTGTLRDRVRVRNEAGALINEAYYGEGNIIEEFMSAAVEVFGDRVLLQFEDFNSNDAFPLLARYRSKYLTYNDDIQGTAAVTVAGILGALKLKFPGDTNLLAKVKRETIVFFGSGSANLGAASLLTSKDGGMPMSNVYMTGSRGLIWKSEDGSDGTYRNNEQKLFAVSPEPKWAHKRLIDIVSNVKPTILVGAAGHAPGAFDREVVEKMVTVNAEGTDHEDPSHRPVIFALSNPTSQAEATSEEVYTFSKGAAIYGSGTGMPPVTISGQTHYPGQVNNVYIFPAMSFAAVYCHAKEITDRLFLVAAEAVANSLSSEDLRQDRVIPPIDRIREVSRNVATAVILACQSDGLAQKQIGATWDEVYASVTNAMYTPTV
jgi:malate dehydrogenase (oxaloacetate-decarboxylating)(NADP+)|eukprot:g996.t1